MYLFPAFLASFLSLVYLFLRLTFDFQGNIVFKTLGLSLFITFFPLIGKLKKRRLPFINKSFLTLVGFIIATILDIKFIFLFGYAFLLIVIIPLIRHLLRPNNLICLFLFSAFAVWLASVSWGLGFQNPLYLESIATGEAHKDILFNSSISQMIKTYGVSSTGLNGIPYVAYHWGSHWLMSRLSKILGIDMISSYQICVPIIWLPFFFQCLFLFVSSLTQTDESLNIKFKPWLFTLLIFSVIGFFPMAYMGILDKTIFFNESYLIATALFFLFSSLIMSWWKALNCNLLMFFASIFLCIIGIMKVPLLLLLVPVAFYLYLRLRLYRNKRSLLFLALVIAITIVVYKITNNRYNDETMKIIPFNFIKIYVPSLWKPWFVLLNYFWLFIFIMLKTRRVNIKNLNDIKKAFAAGQTMDIETLCLMAMIGFVPGNLWFIGGGSAIYFFDFQKWLAISFIIAIIYDADSGMIKTPQLGRIKISHILIGFIGITAFSSFIYNNYLPPIRDLLYRNTQTKNIFYKLSKSKYRMVTTLVKLNNLKDSEKKKSLILIPKKNADYWSLLPCMTTPFIAPALTGIAMIDGLPLSRCRVFAFGYEYYKNYNNVNGNYCSKARQIGFSQIIFVPDSNFSHLKKIKCT